MDSENKRCIKNYGAPIMHSETKKTVPVLDGQIETRLKINQYLISLQMAGMRIKTKEVGCKNLLATKTLLSMPEAEWQWTTGGKVGTREWRLKGD